ncbi:ADP/ATP carrier protein [Clydaea vesicula]|uniref:ADP/ATP carrier protein n=1 Tax=Clydaea vesicula TaxID=447962 RepID=A0AAD5U1N3_9FUNG|nr:ADP/ATP carrier protein [Clydaea vesicula]
MSEVQLTPFQNAVSGSLGALFANTLIFPLDVIKTRIQVQPSKTILAKSKNQHYDEVNHFILKDVFDAFWKIFKEEGLLGLYSGLLAGLTGTVIQNFAYFYAYGLIRGSYAKRVKEISTPMELFLGGLSGASSQLFTLPIGVLTTRQQTSLKHDKKSFIQTVQSIINEDGIRGFWRGLRASLVLCVNPAITYGCFEKLKKTVLNRKGRESPVLGSFEAFVLGAISKTLATIVTYPYIMAKVRLQYKPPSNLSPTEIKKLKYKSAVEVLTKVVKEHGILGWYKGMQTQITKAVFCQAILFMLKEQFNMWTVLLFALASKRKLKN